MKESVLDVLMYLCNRYLDDDMDMYGAIDSGVASCSPIAGRVNESGDCNDMDGAINPEADDICDMTDNDFKWPERLEHYVEEHGVRLPERFVRHALRETR